MTHKPNRREDFGRQMDIARAVMEKDWVALRTLALRDQYPETDLETLLKIAEEQAAARGKFQKSKRPRG